MVRRCPHPRLPDSQGSLKGVSDEKLMETCADSVNKVLSKVYKHLKEKHDKGIVLQPRKKSKKGYKPSHGEVSCIQISLERLLSFSIIILGRSVPPNYMCLKICSSSTGY